MNGAGPDAKLFSHFEDALAGPQLILDSYFQRQGDLWPTKLFTLLYGPLKPGMDSLPDHTALKLGKRPADLKHELASRCRGID